ncbi:MAG: inositol monophosphatase family protein, partial [Alphaproteobacteria bacterium]
MVSDPVHGELFAGRRNYGATLNGAPIRCRTDTDFTRALTGLGASHRVPPDTLAPVLVRLLSAGGMFLRNGSCALSLAYVACGRLNAYYESRINSWDSLAGYLLVREAGGWTNDFLSDDMLL